MTKAIFTGKYAEEARKAMTASVLAGQHLIMLAPPGWGKTAMYKAFMGQVFGDSWAEIRLHPTVPVSEIMGSLDYKATMNTGTEVYNASNTPFDANVKAFAVDEVGRGNDAVYNALLLAADQKNGNLQKPMIATANFLPSGPQHEAVLDRIAMWVHIVPDRVDAQAMAKAQINRLRAQSGMLEFANVPTLAEVEAAWAAVPGDKAAAAVTDVIVRLEAEAAANGYAVHPRRIEQWAAILFRVSYHYTGGNDNFDAVAPEAIDAIRYAWTAKTAAEAAQWAQVVGVMADPVQTAIDSVLTETVGTLNGLLDSTNGDPAALTAIAGEAGQTLAQAQASLSAFGDDPRITDAIGTLNGWFGQIVTGQRIERV